MNNHIKVLKALSDETRMKIVDLLISYDFCVGAISRKIGISEAAVSQHLQVLRKAGLVEGEKRGHYTHYELNRALFQEAADAIHAFAARETPRRGCRQHVTGDHRYCESKKKLSRKA